MRYGSRSWRQPQLIAPEDELGRLRANFVQTIGVIAILMGVAGTVAQVAIGLTRGSLNPYPTISTVIFVILSAGMLRLTRRGYIQQTAIGYVALLVLTYLTIQTLDTSALIATVTLISASILVSSQIYVFINLMVFGKLALYMAALVAETGMQVRDEGVLIVSFASILLVVSLTTRYFISAAEKSAVNAQRNSTLLEATAQVAQITSKILDLGELFPKAVELIRDGFGYYHVQIFLVDKTGHEARLVASTGDAGQRLLERDHRLSVGSQSVIGQVTLTGLPVIARAGDDAVHARNELLPDTQAELALPIFDGPAIIGALDVQSRDSREFSSTVVQALQVLANQIGTSIRNARLFEAQAGSVQENERLVKEARLALREVERLNERLTGRAWEEYLRARRADISAMLQFDDDLPGVPDDGEWSAAQREAIRMNHLIQQTTDSGQVIAVPLRVRGKIIGALELELDQSGNFTPEDFDLVREVTERFGLAVENARLVDQSQRLAQREALVNQITTRLQASNDVDAMVAEAAQGLREALKAHQVKIRLGAPKKS